mmetsp:Transcript_4173/g.17583  ORF Transcript_4173/g.17583 Transcript_4173/m.17583 type:complete len:334 (+) Transcript_4173:433-1434(+)
MRFCSACRSCIHKQGTIISSSCRERWSSSRHMAAKTFIRIVGRSLRRSSSSSLSSDLPSNRSRSHTRSLTLSTSDAKSSMRRKGTSCGSAPGRVADVSRERSVATGRPRAGSHAAGSMPFQGPFSHRTRILGPTPDAAPSGGLVGPAATGTAEQDAGTERFLFRPTTAHGVPTSPARTCACASALPWKAPPREVRRHWWSSGASNSQPRSQPSDWLIMPGSSTGGSTSAGADELKDMNAAASSGVTTSSVIVLLKASACASNAWTAHGLRRRRRCPMTLGSHTRRAARRAKAAAAEMTAPAAHLPMALALIAAKCHPEKSRKIHGAASDPLQR